MHEPQSAADIRAIHDDAPSEFVLRFTLIFACCIVTVPLINMVLGLSDSSVYRLAAFAAYVGTRPTEPPRFRSIGRFAVGAFISTLFCFTAPLVSAVFTDVDLSFWSAFGQVLTMLIVAGLLDTILFLSVCVVTPGRT